MSPPNADSEPADEEGLLYFVHSYLGNISILLFSPSTKKRNFEEMEFHLEHRTQEMLSSSSEHWGPVQALLQLQEEASTIS